jgi:hypothetical protein
MFVVIFMRKAVIILFCLILLPLAISAQVYDGKFENSPVYDHDLFQPHFNLNIGTSFNYSPVIGAGTMLTVSPSFSLPVTRRISMNGGIIASSTILPSLTGKLQMEPVFKPGAFNNLSLYGTTVYQLSPDFVLYGSGFKQLTKNNLPYLYNPFPQSSITFGSRYKIGPNITVGASVNMSQYNNFYSPYNNFYPLW